MVTVAPVAARKAQFQVLTVIGTGPHVCPGASGSSDELGRWSLVSAEHAVVAARSEAGPALFSALRLLQLT